jgi:hypothetical protein
VDSLQIFVLSVIGLIALPVVWSMSIYSIKNRNKPVKRDKYYRD